VSMGYDDVGILRNVTWRLGPGDRVALVGVNGSGKTSVVRLLDGSLEPREGIVKRGVTVKLAHLSQNTVEIPGHLRVLESLEQVRLRTTLGDGREMTASMLCDRFGFRGPRSRTLVKDLSGGERRRLQLMRLLMEEPNVLLLDEPTNDLDIDTLTALEDLLDGWPGTLVVVSHDRYFVERVCDNVYGLMGDGKIRHLPGGIDQYVKLRHDSQEAPPARPAKTAAPAGAAVKAARKDVQRIERDLARLAEREATLHEEMAASATDPSHLRGLNEELGTLIAEREQLEASWLDASELLEA
jgi:ABC transport system ATP-binding/permease protein